MQARRLSPARRAGRARGIPRAAPSERARRFLEAGKARAARPRPDADSALATSAGAGIRRRDPPDPRGAAGRLGVPPPGGAPGGADVFVRFDLAPRRAVFGGAAEDVAHNVTSAKLPTLPEWTVIPRLDPPGPRLVRTRVVAERGSRPLSGGAPVVAGLGGVLLFLAAGCGLVELLPALRERPLAARLGWSYLLGVAAVAGSTYVLGIAFDVRIRRGVVLAPAAVLVVAGLLARTLRRGTPRAARAPPAARRRSRRSRRVRGLGLDRRRPLRGGADAAERRLSTGK